MENIVFFYFHRTPGTLSSQSAMYSIPIKYFLLDLPSKRLYCSDRNFFWNIFFTQSNLLFYWADRGSNAGSFPFIAAVCFFQHIFIRLKWNKPLYYLLRIRLMGLWRWFVLYNIEQRIIKQLLLVFKKSWLNYMLPNLLTHGVYRINIIIFIWSRIVLNRVEDNATAFYLQNSLSLFLTGQAVVDRNWSQTL